MDTEISEHGVGAPSTEELDGVGVDAGTEESRGPTRTERTGRDQSWVDAGLVLHLEGSMAESIGDEAGRHVVPLTIVRADMVVERCLGSGFVTLEVKGKAASGLARTEEGIVGCGMTYFLAPYAVLLARELQSRVSDLEDCLVIQRRGRSGVDLAIDVEVKVHEAEGLGATVFQGVGVLSRAEEPEEGKDAEVDDMAVGLAPLGVLSVEGIQEGDEDRSVDWVGAGRGTVFVGETLDKRSE